MHNALAQAAILMLVLKAPLAFLSILVLASAAACSGVGQGTSSNRLAVVTTE